MITALLLRIKGYAAAAIGAVLFLTFAYFRARQDGKSAAEAAQARKQADAIKQKRESDEDIDRMGVDHLHTELGKWMRGDK